MTKTFPLAFFVALSATIASAQESPSPTPTESASPSPTVSASATAPARSVPLRFVPPPMEGTISLGIWDSDDKLVRILHREATIDSFTIDENSLKTTWDGKNDAGDDLPAGRYRARGYSVAKLKVEDLGKAEGPRADESDHIPVKLVPNPLNSDTRAVMEVGVGFDDKGSFLKTTDGLPLATLSETPNVTRLAIKKDGEKTVGIWQEDATGIEYLRVSGIDKMMAFDCGFFELR